MFRKISKKEKQLPEEEAMEIISAGEYGVLATASPDNYPYAVPLNYVYHNGKIYFHCALSGHKIENMEHNPRVSFCIVRESEIIPEKFSTKFKSVVLFGKAAEVHDEEKKEGLMALVRRFSGEHIREGEKYIRNAIEKTKVFRIEIEHMTCKGKV